MNIDVSIVAPIGGIIALLFAMSLYFSVKKQSPGNEKMQELSSAIRKGAMAFLKSEYKVLIIFIIVVAALLFIASIISPSMSRGKKRSSLRIYRCINSFQKIVLLFHKPI